MGIIELLLAAVSLSMDAFAVSICKGLSLRKTTWKNMMCAGLWFGGFQGLMPLIGYFLGNLLPDICRTIHRGSPSSCWHGSEGK